QQYESCKPGSNEAPLGHVRQHFMHIKELVQPDIRKEMKAGIEKREQAEHATETNHPELPTELAQRRNCQRDQEKNSYPVTGGVGNDLNRIRAQMVRVTLPAESGYWQQTGKKDQDFDPAQ